LPRHNCENSACGNRSIKYYYVCWQITIDLDIEYSTNESRNRTLSLFSSRPESPTESTDERQMLLDVEQNIANLEKTFTDSRRLGERQEDSENNGGKEVVSGSRTHKKGLFRYSSFGSDKDAGNGNDRKRWYIASLPVI